MLAVHFGAGNIGRGFIGQLLYQAGYETCFVDVNSEIIDELNKKNAYTVVLADDTQAKIKVKHVWGINSLENPEQVIEMITKADLITTAVGPTILCNIAKLIATALEARISQNQKPLNIIACENMIGGSEYLKKETFSYLNETQIEKVTELIGFPDAAVDRIVPIQSHEDKLRVAVEAFYEWIVDKSQIKGDIPAIDGITYVDNLLPYIERKLFTVNTGHAVTAYLGSYYGLPTIKDAIHNQQVREQIEEVLNETGALLVKKHNFNKVEHEQYIAKILSRFENEHISDEVDRVARSPIRKLGENDRLIKPARELIESGIPPINLSVGIAAAFLYENDQDEEAKEMKAYLKDHSLTKVISKYTGVPSNSHLHDLIVSTYEKLDKESNEKEA